MYNAVMNGADEKVRPTEKLDPADSDVDEWTRLSRATGFLNVSLLRGRRRMTDPPTRC